MINNLCALTPLFSFLGKSWTLHILKVLQQKNISFGDIKRLLPRISDKVLASRLQLFEELGIILKENKKYSVTKKGSVLHAQLGILEKNVFL